MLPDHSQGSTRVFCLHGGIRFTLSTKVTLYHAIILRTSCGANLVTQHPSFRPGHNPYRGWRSNPSGKSSQERLARGTVISTWCGAGAGCSAIKYKSLCSLPCGYNTPVTFAAEKSLTSPNCEMQGYLAHKQQLTSLGPL
jgi:hypothetical protein